MALLLCCGMILPRQTCAQSASFVSLEGSSQCFSLDELERAVSLELGDLEVPPELFVTARVGEQLGLSLRDGEDVVATRTFEKVPEGCDAQLKMLAVVIAMAIEHHVASVEVRESAEKEAEPVLVPPPEDPESAREASPVVEEEPDTQAESKDAVEEAPNTLALRGSASLGYSYGMLPTPAPVFEFGVDLLLRSPISLGVGLLVSDRVRAPFHVPEADSLSNPPPSEAFTQAVFQGVAGKAQGCWEPRFEGGAWGLCLGVLAGRFHARGVEGFGGSSGAALPWMAAYSRLAARVPARGPFGLGLTGDFFANLLRPGVELSGVGSAESPRDTPVVGGAVSLSAFFVYQ